MFDINKRSGGISAAILTALLTAPLAATGAHAAPPSFPMTAGGTPAPAEAARMAAIIDLLAHPGIPSAHRPRVGQLAPPAILSGELLTSTLTLRQAVDTPRVRFKYTAPATLSFVNFGFTSPSGQSYYDAFFNYAPVGTKGTLYAQYAYQPMSRYAEQGIWNLTTARIIDSFGNETDYDAAQLAGMFPSLTMNVVNPKYSDNVAPTVSAGKILTPVVNLNQTFPVFGIELDVADNISGVGEVGFTLTAPDGSGPWEGLAVPGAPVLHGKANSYLDIGGLPSGTWTINTLIITDLAGNTLTISDSGTITSLLGTTTFQATN